jgi:hypothetical protein
MTSSNQLQVDEAMAEQQRRQRLINRGLLPDHWTPLSSASPSVSGSAASVKCKLPLLATLISIFVDIKLGW